MYLWVVYDIPLTRRRTKVFRICEDFGLVHVQESVFVGMIDDDRYEVFVHKLENVVDYLEDTLYILPASKKMIEGTHCIAGSFDKKLALRDHLLLFV